ncbi:MAG: DNA recombination protein RmuC [Acidobacteria bacterium]|nr:DNA recombination protein RmuC [Acidobacteriota bacterium]
METLLVVVAVLLAVVLAVLFFQLARASRQEHAVRDELGRLQLALADSQRGAAERMSSQLTDVLDRVHRALGDFGQQVATGQASTGDTLRGELEEARRTLAAQLEGLVGQVNVQLAQTQQNMGQQFEGATKVFGDLRGQLGQVAEMAARMEALGREIEELQGILRAPKLRGNLGEASLEEFLRQVLPPTFWETQYRFAGGQTVDAVIKLRDHLVPVDAKFPLESFQRLLAASDDAGRKAARKEFERSVRGRIDEIADKYIRPGEGTFEFALMFIPAENVYYEVIIRDENLGDAASLLNYATSRRVVPVSPNSFYAYLATIATGLKGMQVEQRSREILAELGKLQRDFDKLAEELRLLGRHLASAQGKFEQADKLAARFGERLSGVTGQPLEPGEDATRDALPPD